MQNNESDHLIVEIQDGIMQIKLNRPQSLNAFSSEMISGLKKALSKAKTDMNIRVVTIAGSGRAFSAGGDVKGMGRRTPLGTYEHLGNLNELIILMKELEKPIVAAVHGYAAGAGFNLALACDMILAADGSKFVLSFSKVGLISDGGGLYFLPRLIGTYRAKELLFNAEPISVEEAYSLGIVNHIYPFEDFEQKVMEYSAKLAAGPSTAFGFIKKIADQSLQSSLAEVLEQERISQATVATTEDHAEGILAFKEKRSSNFVGK
ncbi:enoyl-CoA hydratase/isomerase family protein [Lentibacillus jeotgali]|uniref:enoyl-CoA hydratase/isomerase family protein n=1 Tax=Lentibacillus jeotgali TaxID=558169 RepID=UPI0002628BD5|nr:enoyl-CoA hydratase [Lentibacillus jeotgali]